MQEQLISLETAKLAKDKGFEKWFSDFSEKYHHLKGWREYDNYIDEVELPEVLILSILQKWLREEKQVNVFCLPNRYDSNQWYYVINAENISQENTNGTYEQALEEGLKRALELI